MTPFKRAWLTGFLLFAILAIATASAIIIREKRLQLSQHEATRYSKVELYVCEKAAPYIYGNKLLEGTDMQLTIKIISTIETSGSLTRALCVESSGK